MDKFLYGLKTTPAVPECKEESDRVLYPGMNNYNFFPFVSYDNLINAFN